MIYLHPSLGISNAPSTPPRITDPSYIDRIYEFAGGNKAQFSVVIEASNGTVLDDIKETRLTAHLFDADGRELTEHLTALSLYWEEHNEAWTEVGRGWSYLVNDNSRFLRLLRVRVSQLDIMTALGLTIDAETKKTLAGIMVQQEVKITSSSYIYSRIPSVEALHDSLVNDVHFRELVKGAQGPQGKPGAAGAPGKDGKSVTLADLNIGWQGDKLVVAGQASQSLKGERGERGLQGIQGLKGEQGIQGIQGLQGKPGVAGKDGKSVTLADLNIGWQGDKLVVAGQASQSLKGERGERGLQGIQGLKGEQGIQGIQGLQGKPGVAGKDGKDATPVRPNLWLSNVKIYPNMGHGADNVHVTYKGDGVYRVTKHDKMYVVVSMYSDKLQEHKTTKTIITSWRVAGASRQELLEEKYLKNKNGRYYIAKNTEHKEVNVRGTLYAHPWLGDENHWIDGDWIEFADVKVELVEDGDILEPTAYIPNIPSLDYLATSTAQKITQESIYLSRIRNGMASYQDLQQVQKIVNGHQVNWDTLDDNYLRPIRQLQEALKNKQNDADRRLGNVEQDIIRFTYRAINTNSSEWTDYTHTEYVGGGYKPDPWGGGGADGYIRTVHDYEIYRAMDGIPSTYIEQSKKVLRDKEYKIGDKYHRDGSATIVYDIQSLSDIERGQARHWRLFTTPYASNVLRYGNRTTMGNQDIQVQQIGSYYNVHLDKGTTYDIYAYNDGSGKYKLYIITNGSYK